VNENKFLSWLISKLSRFGWLLDIGHGDTVIPIPHEATAGGRLELEWTSGEGERSCEVAEVWLIRHTKENSSKP